MKTTSKYKDFNTVKEIVQASLSTINSKEIRELITILQTSEALKPKIGDVCKFYDNAEDNETEFVIDILSEIHSTDEYYAKNSDRWWEYCIPLTQEEVIDLLFTKED